MPQLTLVFNLAPEAAARLVAGSNGSDTDVWLSIEKAIAGILDTEKVEIVSDVEGAADVLGRHLACRGYTGSALTRLVGDWTPPSAFRVEKSVTSAVHNPPRINTQNDLDCYQCDSLSVPGFVVRCTTCRNPGVSR